jgi:Protein of unknown function (DUF3102)
MTSKRLPVLAAEIREAHAAVLASARTTGERAVRVGKLLIEAKATVPHGGWIPWLKEIGLSPRTAQRYMRLAELPADKYDTVSHLGVKGALEAISLSPEMPTPFPLPKASEVTNGVFEEAIDHKEVFIWPSEHDGYFQFLLWRCSSKPPTDDIDVPAEFIAFRRPMLGRFLATMLSQGGEFPVDDAKWEVFEADASILEGIRRNFIGATQ